jgi:hypothetical protein
MQDSGAGPCRDAGCVFLSHTGQDPEGWGSQLAERMCEKLTNAGKKSFFDARTHEWGAHESAMLDAVRTCGVFVALVTPQYTLRKWPLKELHQALQSDRKIRIVCISITHEDLKTWAQGSEPKQLKLELGFDPAKDVMKLLKTNILYKQSNPKSKTWLPDLAKELVDTLVSKLSKDIEDTEELLEGAPGANCRPVYTHVQVCAFPHALCIRFFSLCALGIEWLW